MPTRAERQADAARRRAQVVQARLAGASFEEIGRQLGVSDTRAHQLWTDALERTIKEPADRHRALELQRLDQLQLSAVRVLRDGHVVIQGGKVVADRQGRPYTDHAPVLQAINTLLRVAERRARLLGLDAPAKVDAKVDGHVTVDHLDDQIRDLEAELAALDPAFPEQRRREQEHAHDLRSFRTRWQQPGHGPVVDVAGFIAEALALTVGLLDLDDGERERVAVEVEHYLMVAARG
jgi:hypothetical protein